MKHRHPVDEHNLWLPLLAALLLLLIPGLYFDYYYQLNDDVVIKDILSGAYGGRPDGHTNQLLFPLGALLAAGYRLLPQIPVFAWFLLLCSVSCFWLIGHRSLRYFNRLSGKLAVLFLELGLFLGMFLWELVYVQYSVVCGTMVATACFWFYTGGEEEGAGRFWLFNLPALFLIWTAFCLRSEMTLLLTPFVAVVGLWHWAGSNTGERFKRSLSRYILFILVAAAGCGLLYTGDLLAHSAEDWKSYRQFFDARTTVYDYTWYPAYDRAQDYYEAIGISREQYELVDSYNFALDPTIDAGKLEAIGEYGERARHQGSWPTRIRAGIWEMGYRTLTGQDAPYNYFVLAAYAAVIGVAVVCRDKSYIWKLLLLGMARVIPWMYLILAGRVVERIAHPLYLIEFLCLMGLIGESLRDRPLWNPQRLYRRVVFALLFLLMVVTGIGRFQAVKAEQKRREGVNQTMDSFREYAYANPENYYFLDVYSTVAYSERLFDENTNRHKNYDILGGWVCYSPLQKEILARYTKEGQQEEGSISEALLQENVYFVIRDNRPVESITGYYESMGTPVELTRVHDLGTPEDCLVIYRLEVSGTEEAAP